MRSQRQNGCTLLVGGQEGEPCLDLLVPNVDRAAQELERRGVSFPREPHDVEWGARIAVFSDPDGHTLQLTQIDWPRYFAANAPR